MEAKLFIYMKEKVLSQENLKSSKDGLTSTKVVDFREQFLEERSSKISSDPGLEICETLVWMIGALLDLHFKKLPHREAKELWILMNYGSEVLKEHRDTGFINQGF